MPPHFTAFSEKERTECEAILRRGFAEDLGAEGDITSRALIAAEEHGSARILARSCGFVAGLPAVELLATFDDFELRGEVLSADGPTEAGAPVARLSGPLCSILAVERVLLNVLGRLSGIATLTASFVARIAATTARIYDTRKTTPGWRRLEKYAVRIGGGYNHRGGLSDAVLIKDNHLAALARQQRQPILHAVRRARQAVPPGTTVEVEVDSLVQLEEALSAGPDIILLDNMAPDLLSIAVEMRNLRAPHVALEASGGITLENVRQVALAGVERISIGALTHSAPALDLGLDLDADR
jgi:nicotinate-nucleotide pyrophosphorylase (carboxylating)